MSVDWGSRPRRFSGCFLIRAGVHPTRIRYGSIFGIVEIKAIGDIRVRKPVGATPGSGTALEGELADQPFEDVRLAGKLLACRGRLLGSCGVGLDNRGDLVDSNRDLLDRLGLVIRSLGNFVHRLSDLLGMLDHLQERLLGCI